MHIVDIHIFPAIIVETEHIDVVDSLAHDHTLGAIVLEQTIAFLELLRLFEAHLRSQGRHFIAQIAHELLRLATENLPYAVDVPVVGRMVDLACAATFAFLYVVLQAKPPFTPRQIVGRDGNAACTHRI